MANEPIALSRRVDAQSAENLLRIFEDIGALKAIAAAINEKLDERNEQLKSLHVDQIATTACIAKLQADAENRTTAMERIEQKLEKLEKKVEPLVAWRDKISGGVIILSVVASLIYGVVHFVEPFVKWTIDPSK